MARSGKKAADSAHGVSISVDDDNLGRIHDVADDLRSAGLDVSQVMPVTGTILGTVEPGKLAALKKVRGVSGVEAERVVQIPPPDADVQ